MKCELTGASINLEPEWIVIDNCNGLACAIKKSHASAIAWTRWQGRGGNYRIIKI